MLKLISVFEMRVMNRKCSSLLRFVALVVVAYRRKLLCTVMRATYFILAFRGTENNARMKCLVVLSILVHYLKS